MRVSVIGCVRACILRWPRHDRRTQLGMRRELAMEADQIQPGTRHQCRQALHELQRRHDHPAKAADNDAHCMRSSVGAGRKRARLIPQPSRHGAADAINYFARAIGARTVVTSTTPARMSRNSQLPCATPCKRRNRTTGRSKWKQVDIQRQEASAWLAHAEGNPGGGAQADARLAAELEDSTYKHPVTQQLVPAHELLGDLLLELQQPAQACKHSI